jgi:hypothetical protein
MYKYIKGKEVLVDEHMLSATELAKQFGLLTVNNNPNGLLVCQILSDYVKDSNLNISDYFYPHGHGVMRVYPFMVYDKALREFVFDLEENKEYTYIVRDNVKGRSKINYKYKQPRERNTIISITERRQVNEHKR